MVGEIEAGAVPSRETSGDKREERSREIIRAYLAELGYLLGDGVAKKVAHLHFRFFGGLRISHPGHNEYIREQRDREMKLAFTGRNHRELADRFGVDLRTVYRVVNRT